MVRRKRHADELLAAPLAGARAWPAVQPYCTGMVAFGGGNAPFSRAYHSTDTRLQSRQAVAMCQSSAAKAVQKGSLEQAAPGGARLAVVGRLVQDDVGAVLVLRRTKRHKT